MKLVVGKKEYPVKPITINDYDFFSTNPELGDLELVSRFTDCPTSELKTANFQQIKFAAKMIKSSFGAEDDKSPLQLVFELEGVKYGLIKPSELSYEEWVNLEVFMAQSPLNLGLLATHLYKPLKSDKIGDERELIDYDLSECQSRIELFKEKLPMSIIISAFFFIATFVQKLTESFLGSMEAKMKEPKPQMKKPKIIHKR